MKSHSPNDTFSYLGVVSSSKWFYCEKSRTKKNSGGIEVRLSGGIEVSRPTTKSKTVKQKD